MSELLEVTFDFGVDSNLNSGIYFYLIMRTEKKWNALVFSESQKSGLFRARVNRHLLEKSCHKHGLRLIFARPSTCFVLPQI